MKPFLAGFAVFALSVAASAQVTTIGVFTGAAQENFDTYPQVVGTLCIPNRVFGATADMCTIGGAFCLTTSGWGFSCSISNYSSPRFFGSMGGATEIIFDTPIAKFGGYFGTNSNVDDGTIEFYDAAGALIATSPVDADADCAWHWNGYQSSVAVKRVVLSSNYGGGFLDMDSLECAFASTAPTVYCTAGTSVAGCVASIGATGNPNVAHNAPCQIDVTLMEGQRTGVVFYGLTPLIQPWCVSGGSSFLCVKTPIQRAFPQNSGGTFGQCDGALALDWNAFQSANPTALGNPWLAGEKAYVQGWFRDPSACKTTSLSDAVELTYQP